MNRMKKQQILTALNNKPPSNYRLKDKKANQITDFINGTYQGYNTQAAGVIIDDQFNFIISSHFHSPNRLHGETYIKLASQLAIWGQWRENLPHRLSSVQIGSYTVHIPQMDEMRGQRRAKKCVVFSKNREKAYFMRITANPSTSNPRRQFSMVIQKSKSLHSSSASSQASDYIETEIAANATSAQTYLEYLQDELKLVLISRQSNGNLITMNPDYGVGQYFDHGVSLKLGLLLRDDFTGIKSVGIFTKDTSFQSGTSQKEKERGTQRLNGLGMCKTTTGSTLIGAFKKDMIVRQFNDNGNGYDHKIEHNGYDQKNRVKEMLSHEHMKSMSYEHSYLYFPHITKIVDMAIELHKYVDMFERLSSHQPDSSEVDSVCQDQQEKAQKYSHRKQQEEDRQQKEDRKQWHQSEHRLAQKLQESSESIIDQYRDFRVILKKDKYLKIRGQEQNQNKAIIDNMNNQTNIENMSNQPDIQNMRNAKKPGFILHRSPSTSKGTASHRSGVKLNRKIQNRTPPRHEHQWKF